MLFFNLIKILNIQYKLSLHYISLKYINDMEKELTLRAITFTAKKYVESGCKGN